MNNTAHTIHYKQLPNGRLANLQEWTPDAAQYLARTQQLTLTDKHWEIINLMRDFYAQFNISPVRKLLLKHIREKLGTEKANNDYLNELFPGDVLIQGTLIAGLPLPLLDMKINPADHPAPYNESHKAPCNVKHFVDQFEMDGQTYKLTFHGNLQDGSQWNEKVTEFMAKKEGITLTDEHWELIAFLRQFYFKYGITPMVKLLQKHLSKKLGKEKGSEDYLYNLFPEGSARQGLRIAGLPESQGCID